MDHRYGDVVIDVSWRAVHDMSFVLHELSVVVSRLEGNTSTPNLVVLNRMRSEEATSLSSLLIHIRVTNRLASLLLL